MSLLTAVRETYGGFKSLLVGMRITLGQAVKPTITVQYPRETLKMPERFRGHVKLILDPETGKSRCTACGLCVKACPSGCIELEGCKREGEKKKSVTEYDLDFTKCSLCGCCVEACPSDAIEYSKDYNKVSFNRDDFGHMNLVGNLEAEAKVWSATHPQPATPAAVAPVAVAGLAEAGRPGSAIPATPTTVAVAPVPARVTSTASAAAPVAAPAPKPSVEASKPS